MKNSQKGSFLTRKFDSILNLGNHYWFVRVTQKKFNVNMKDSREIHMEFM